AEAEDDVGRCGRVVGEEARLRIGQPRPRALREIALEAAAAERAEGVAVFADDRARAGAAVRRAARGHDGDEDAALPLIGDAADGGEGFVDFVHGHAERRRPAGSPGGVPPPARETRASQPAWCPALPRSSGGYVFSGLSSPYLHP